MMWVLPTPARLIQIAQKILSWVLRHRWPIIASPSMPLCIVLIGKACQSVFLCHHVAATVRLNAAESKSEGVELEVQARLTEHLQLDVSASYGEATLTEDAENLGEKGITCLGLRTSMPVWLGIRLYVGRV